MTYQVKRTDDNAILVGLQSALGSPATPTAANAALLFEPTLPTTDAVETERALARPFMGAHAKSYGAPTTRLGGIFELIGNASVGTAAPVGIILRACGFSQTLVAATSATYAPVSTGFEYSTVWFFDADTRYPMTDALGEWTEINLEIGAIPRMTVEFFGPYSPPNDNAPPSGIDLSGNQEPLPLEEPNWLVTYDGIELATQKLMISCANTSSVLHTSEIRAASRSKREISGTLTVLKTALSAFNPHARFRAQTKAPLVSVINQGAGKIITITLANVQIGKIALGDIDDKRAWEIPFTAVATVAGDDLEIEFT